MFELTPEALINEILEIILMTEEIEVFNSKMDQLKANEILQFETILINKNTQQIFVSLSISLAKNRSSRIYGYIISCYDITKLKQLE